MVSDYINVDYRIIMKMVRPGSSVLDLGCHKGELLSILIRENNVKAHGIEIDEKAIYECVARGIGVSHQDIDNGLSEYGDQSFDYVIMNHSLQQVKKPDTVLKEALRVGKEVVIGFPNFAHYKARFQVFFKGKTPITQSLPYEWFDTPNLHFMSISDFRDYCRKNDVKIKSSAFLFGIRTINIFPNFFARTRIFLISK
ncbi:Bifunctional methionine biosynthesis protein MetXA/MetW [Methanosarcinales archaeon]|nr:methionine biosynthesis protein MetW [Candidatus Methanoperedens sp.]CAG0973365.1 Bifunctional methionine biosynthesis protein MetXA/MetW [Methanosarcinales archaeon]